MQGLVPIATRFYTIDCRSTMSAACCNGKTYNNNYVQFGNDLTGNHFLQNWQEIFVDPILHPLLYGAIKFVEIFPKMKEVKNADR